jgi:hypothetical protein
VQIQGDRLPAHELAWEYDIVLTTFNRLSCEWGAASPLKQVRLARTSGCRACVL